MPTKKPDPPDKDDPPKKRRKASPRKGTPRPAGQSKAAKPARAVVEVDPYLAARGEAMAKMEAYGVERVVDDVLDHVPLRMIAEKVGVSNASLLRWISLDDARMEQINKARKLTAQGWEELAEQVVAQAADPFQLMKAKELAHHYRWRAACISPKFNPSAKGDGDGKKIDDPVAAMRALADKLPD